MGASISGQFSPEDRVVVVMGPAGAGKSTFIDCASGQNGKSVDNSRKPETLEVRSVRVAHPTYSHPIVFVDTPGFDNTLKPDGEVLAMIADWLMQTYKADVNLAIILYLHRISDNRMSGTAMKNLESFSRLCGRKAMPNVVIVTTMWSLVPAEWGTKQEEILKREVRSNMLDGGCGIERFRDTSESAWNIVGSVMQKNLGAPDLRQDMDGRRRFETERAVETKGKQKALEDRGTAQKRKPGGPGEALKASVQEVSQSPALNEEDAAYLNQDAEEWRYFETEKIFETEGKQGALEDRQTVQNRKAEGLNEALKAPLEAVGRSLPLTGEDVADNRTPRRKRYSRHHKRRHWRIDKTRHS